jgi:hypothetical protein
VQSQLRFYSLVFDFLVIECGFPPLLHSLRGGIRFPVHQKTIQKVRSRPHCVRHSLIVECTGAVRYISAAARTPLHPMLEPRRGWSHSIPDSTTNDSRRLCRHCRDAPNNTRTMQFFVKNDVLVSTIGLSPAESGYFNSSAVVLIQGGRKMGFTGRQDPALMKEQAAICGLLAALRCEHPSFIS